MPTIGIRKRILDEYLGEKYSEEEFDKICFDFGVELDDIVSEKFVVKGVSVDEVVYKIELPANRCDLWSLEGLTKALNIFLGKAEIPKYKLIEPANGRQKLIIKEEVNQIRPYCVAAVLRDVQFTEESYASFIDFQDKLHQNLCRKRTLCAIGTHDLDTIKGPFTYTARPPTEIVFKPLNQTKEYNAQELMQLYATDSHLRHYLHIIEGSSVFPVIYDSENVVLSMPPIINGEHSKISVNTKNIFIECTATHLNKAIVVLDTLCTTFSQYTKNKFCIEPADVVQVDGSIVTYPILATRKEIVSVENINTTVGVSLKSEEMAALLKKMCLESEILQDGKKLEVSIPPTRHDIIQQSDVIEDVAIAYGYNNIQCNMPDFCVSANQFSLTKLTDLLRAEIANAGFTEVCAFSLCSRDDIGINLRNPEAVVDAVHIANPKTLEFQVCRTTLLSGILKTLHYNRDMPLPLKLFEIQDVVLRDPERDPTYFPGRCAAVIGPGNVHIGTLGVLHPQVMQAFDLTLPCSALEMNIEQFL